MLIIPIKEGENLDKALKKLKRKFEKTGIMNELRERQKYTKPSERRRSIVQRAKFIQRLKQQKGQ